MANEADIAKGALIGAIAGAAFTVLNDVLFPKAVPKEQRRYNLMKHLSPSPHFMYVDTDLINLFTVLARFRGYSNSAYERALRRADRLCFYALQRQKGEVESSDALTSMARDCVDIAMESLKKIYVCVKAADGEDITRRESRRLTRSTEDVSERDSMSLNDIYKLYPIDDIEDIEQVKKLQEKLADRLPHEVIAGLIDAVYDRLVHHFKSVGN